MSRLKPNRTVLTLYEHVLVRVHKDTREEIRTEIENLRAQITDKRKQIEEVEDRMIIDGTHSDRYARILDRYEKEVQEMELKVKIMQTPNETDLKPKLHYVISLINNVVMYIRDAPLEVKTKLIGLMFPEKIVFDGKQHQTKSMNKVLDLIYQQTSELRGHKKRNETDNFLSVSFGTPNRAFLEPLLADLNLLYELRFWIPNPGEPISPQSFHATD